MSQPPGLTGSRNRRTNKAFKPPPLVRQNATLSENRNGTTGDSPKGVRQSDESVDRTFYSSSPSLNNDSDSRAATPTPIRQANDAWDQQSSSDRFRSPSSPRSLPASASRSGTAAGSSRRRDSERVAEVGDGLRLFPRIDNTAAAAAHSRQQGSDGRAVSRQITRERQRRDTFEQTNLRTGYKPPIRP